MKFFEFIILRHSSFEKTKQIYFQYFVLCIYNPLLIKYLFIDDFAYSLNLLIK